MADVPVKIWFSARLGTQNPADTPSRRPDYQPKRGGDMLSLQNKALITDYHPQLISPSTSSTCSTTPHSSTSPPPHTVNISAITAKMSSPSPFLLSPPFLLIIPKSFLVFRLLFVQIPSGEKLWSTASPISRKRRHRVLQRSRLRSQVPPRLDPLPASRQRT